jgi:hypothetical protein
VEPNDVAEVVKRHGRLVLGEGGELMVELTDPKAAKALSAALFERFGNQVLICP